MSEPKSRRWGVYVFRVARGAPMVSLGIHIDLHTPRVDLHLPLVLVSIGRIVWEPGTRRFFYLDDHERWGGHTDDCWHREVLAHEENERLALRGAPRE